MNEIMQFYAPLFTPELRGLFLFCVFVLGSCVGSFLNVCIWRMPLRESVIFAPSHCTKCNSKLKWYDNIPLMSYLILRGKCRNCRQHFTSRYFFIELATALVFLALALINGENHSSLLLQFTIASVLLACALTDAESGIIPDKLTGFLFVFAILDTFIRFGFESILLPLATACGMFVVLSALAWGGAKLAGQTVLGGGDIKLIAALGAATGLLPTLYITILASLLGMVGGLMYAKMKKRGVNEVKVRFGIFIAAAGIIWLFTADLVRFSVS